MLLCLFYAMHLEFESGECLKKPTQTEKHQLFAEQLSYENVRNAIAFLFLSAREITRFSPRPGKIHISTINELEHFVGNVHLG